MTRENIIRMALEAGISESHAQGMQGFLERFAALIAAHEREACAKVCADLTVHRDLGTYGMLVANTCANDILARGNA
jgi:hypothetical protein